MLKLLLMQEVEAHKGEGSCPGSRCNLVAELGLCISVFKLILLIQKVASHRKSEGYIPFNWLLIGLPLYHGRDRNKIHCLHRLKHVHSTLVSISFIGRRNEFSPRIRLRDAGEHLGNSWELCLVHSSRIQFSFAKSSSWSLVGLGSRAWLDLFWGESWRSGNCPNYLSMALSSHWVTGFLEVQIMCEVTFDIF